ncbi:MAG: hypothetical protein KAY29_00825 [Brevundimonas sp.]|jgi:hypothetical protein|nr:hypothetical protein [Brevundimonas sp.]
MAQGPFAASVGDWVAATQQRMDAVRKESAQRVVEIMQTPVAKGGNMPVKTGFLRASLQGAIGQGAFTGRVNPNPEGAFGYDAAPISLIIAGAKPSDAITLSYVAVYAAAANYGSRGRAGRQFVGLAAQQWQRVVSEVAAEAQQRAAR